MFVVVAAAAVVEEPVVVDDAEVADGVDGLEQRGRIGSADVDGVQTGEECMIFRVRVVGNAAAVALVLTYSQARVVLLLAETAVVVYYDPLAEHLDLETTYVDVAPADVDPLSAEHADHTVESENDGQLNRAGGPVAVAAAVVAVADLGQQHTMELGQLADVDQFPEL